MMAEKRGRPRKIRDPKQESVQQSIDRVLGDDRFSADAVIDRIKHALGMETDSELAWFLGTTRQNVWKWRNRNSVPYREAVFLSLWARLSLDYVLKGDQSARPEWLGDGAD